MLCRPKKEVEEEAAKIKKAADAVADAAADGLNLAADVADAAPDGEMVLNGEIVSSKKRGEGEDYELDKAAEENNI